MAQSYVRNLCSYLKNSDYGEIDICGWIEGKYPSTVPEPSEEFKAEYDKVWKSIGAHSLIVSIASEKKKALHIRL